MIKNISRKKTEKAIKDKVMSKVAPRKKEAKKVEIKAPEIKLVEEKNKFIPGTISKKHENV